MRWGADVTAGGVSSQLGIRVRVLDRLRGRYTPARDASLEFACTGTCRAATSGSGRLGCRWWCRGSRLHPLWRGPPRSRRGAERREARPRISRTGRSCGCCWRSIRYAARRSRRRRARSLRCSLRPSGGGRCHDEMPESSSERRCTRPAGCSRTGGASTSVSLSPAYASTLERLASRELDRRRVSARRSRGRRVDDPGGGQRRRPFRRIGSTTIATCRSAAARATRRCPSASTSAAGRWAARQTAWRCACYPATGHADTPLEGVRRRARVW